MATYTGIPLVPVRPPLVYHPFSHLPPSHPPEDSHSHVRHHDMATGPEGASAQVAVHRQSSVDAGRGRDPSSGREGTHAAV